MLGAVLVGLLSAIIVAVPALLHFLDPSGYRFLSWYSPGFLIGIALVAILLQRLVVDRYPGPKSYNGLADIFIHIHAPSTPDSPLRWVVRGLISFLLVLFGGNIGSEGAAVEWTHAFAMKSRSRLSRWFEQRRRTDAATTLSAAIAASFGAPFAGVLLPVELGVGGRTISSAVSAITAFLAMRYFASFLPLRGFDLGGALYGFGFMDWKEWIGIIVIGIGAGVFGALLIRFIRYSEESLLDLFKDRNWMRILFGGILLFVVATLYRGGYAPSWSLLEQLLWLRRPPSDASILFFSKALLLTLILSSFGSIGVFWPVFALGGFLGFGINHWILQDVAGFSAAAGLAGGAAFWGAVLGAPVAGALLSFELTQNLQILLPCFIASIIAKEVAQRISSVALVDRDLEARGLTLVQGRSAKILDSLLISDAMVTDFETVQEHESVSELRSTLLRSRYPFLPVVKGQGVYAGLLTIDMVQEAWRTEKSVVSNSPLANLLEVKDLLYRSGFKTETVKVGDRLSTATDLLNDYPCIPVLGEGGKIQGMLFVHNVRLAYDREVARRSLMPPAT